MIHSWNRFIAATVILSLAFLAAGQAWAQKVTRDESLRKGETKQTLDPALFQAGPVRNAFQVARDIPWVLDSIYCYCHCEESPAFRHISLLSCYVDRHASM